MKLDLLRRRSLTHAISAFVTSCMIILILMATSTTGSAQLYIDGDNLTASTSNILVTFKGADLVRLRNRLTGEDYIKSFTPGKSMLNLNMLKEPVGQRYVSVGGWHRGSGTAGVNSTGNDLAAQIHLRDLVRNVVVNVIIDPETQDVTVTMMASANRDGVTGLTWGVKGIDLTSGYFALPANGGIMLDHATTPATCEFNYPGQWEAQTAVWQGKGGGFVLYTRDERVRYKQFKLERKGDFADLSVNTLAMGSYKLSGDVPQVEWRLNTFKGDWRVPATGYRNLMKFYRPLTPATGKREWVKTIRTLVKVESDPLPTQDLEALSKRMRTDSVLLYVKNWSKPQTDSSVDAIIPRQELSAFIDKAHELGFRVMLDVNPLRISEHSSLLPKMHDQLALDQLTEAPIAIKAREEKYFKLNPSFPQVRDAVAKLLRPLVEDLNVDVLFLKDTAIAVNDGHGTVEGKNSAEGLVSLQRRLMSAFPKIVIANDGMNELLQPTSFISMRKPSLFRSHPISAFLFGEHVLNFFDDDSNSFKGAQSYLSSLSQQEGQALLPVVNYFGNAQTEGKLTDFKRMLELAMRWNIGQMLPNFGAISPTNLLQWTGMDDPIDILQTGPIVAARQAESVLYSRVSGVSSVKSTSTISNWYGYNSDGPIGLDPSKSYLLTDLKFDLNSIHVSEISPGVHIETTKVSGNEIELRFGSNSVASDDSLATFKVSLGAKGAVHSESSIKPKRVEGNVASFEGIPLPCILKLKIQ